MNADLKNYLFKTILPIYDKLCEGHSSDHIMEVYEEIMELSKIYSVNENYCATIAIYHDIGLMKGRKDHEENSALFLLTDKNINVFFNGSEIKIMADAIRDHRTTNNKEPRTIYGKLLFEADKDLRYDVMIRRYAKANFKYGYSHPTSGETIKAPVTEIAEFVYNEMVSRYGEGGTFKLWLGTDRNVKNLTELRAKIKNKEEFIKQFLINFN